MTKMLVKDLRHGDSVTGAFLATRKELRTTKKGDPFLSLELTDRTGSIEAKVWEGVELFRGAFAERDFVEITGSVTRFRDKLQLEVRDIRALPEEEVELADFIRCCEGDLDELESRLADIAASVQNPYLRELLQNIFGDPVLAVKFRQAPAAKYFHHAYIGGLLQHTENVCRLADLVSNLYPEVDRDLLLAASMLHDLGKIEELQCARTIDYTDEGRFLGHMLIADEILREALTAIPEFPRELELKLRHAILSHHGELEWGAPKRPKTVEALILHHLDNLDAKVNGFLEIVERGEIESGWTDIKNLFRRPLYVPRPAASEQDATEDRGLLF